MNRSLSFEHKITNNSLLLFFFLFSPSLSLLVEQHTSQTHKLRFVVLIKYEFVIFIFWVLQINEREILCNNSVMYTLIICDEWERESAQDLRQK